MYKYLSAFTLVCFLLFSCKKEQTQTNTQAANTTSKPSTINYYGLSVGSYWVYDIYLVDTLNNSTFEWQDSAWIRSDTVVRGNTYYILAGSTLDMPLDGPLRDSAGWLVNNSGLRMCNNTGDTSIFLTLVDTGMSVNTFAMSLYTSIIMVPAGAFTCFDAIGTCKIMAAKYPWPNPRYLNNYYANGVGLIFQTDFYFNSPNHLERRLVRYHIN